jgi:hypothetical protein
MPSSIIFFAIQFISMLAFGLLSLQQYRRSHQALFVAQSSLSEHHHPLDAVQSFNEKVGRIANQFSARSRMLYLGALGGLFIWGLYASYSSGESPIPILAVGLAYYFAFTLGRRIAGDARYVILMATIFFQATATFFPVTPEPKASHKDLLLSLLLMTLPTVFIWEMVALLFLQPEPTPYLFLALLAALVLPATARFVYVSLRNRSDANLRPIPSTSWAQLEERIRHWADLAHIQVTCIRVGRYLLGQDPGITSTSAGKTHHIRLGLSENYLHLSEWRKPDGLLALNFGWQIKRVLSMIKLRRTLLTIRAASLGVLAVSLILFFDEQVRFFSLRAFSLPELQNLTIWGFVPVSLLFGVIVAAPLISAVFLLISLTWLPLINVRKRCFEADRFAVQLTGDPLGIMVSLHTINIINGWSLTAKYGDGRPSIEERLKFLDQMRREGIAHAPYADLPVPARVPARLGTMPLSTSFEQAIPPAPVPPLPA